MSLGIVFKGPEGIVLAADSRVTLMAQLGGQMLPATFDNTTKLLRINRHDYVGVVTYGLGALGMGPVSPRTAHSYISEFEDSLGKKKRFKLVEFAEKLSSFFMKQWENQKMPKIEDHVKGRGPDMVFLLGGYNADEPYGRVYEIGIPSRPTPKEWHPGNSFGPVWGGQQEFVGRLIHGFDPNLPGLVQQNLKLTDEQVEKLKAELSKEIQKKIPYPFLPLQDCVNLSVLLIQTTMQMQSFYVGLRGVGGEIDVATITKTGGFQPVREKNVAKLFDRRSNT